MIKNTITEAYKNVKCPCGSSNVHPLGQDPDDCDWECLDCHAKFKPKDVAKTTGQDNNDDKDKDEGLEIASVTEDYPEKKTSESPAHDFPAAYDKVLDGLYKIYEIVGSLPLPESEIRSIQSIIDKAHDSLDEVNNILEENGMFDYEYEE
jgi:hypothetical protein